MKTPRQAFYEAYRQDMSKEEIFDLIQDFMTDCDLKYPVVIHPSYGAFSISHKLAYWLRDNKGWDIEDGDKIYCYDCGALGKYYTARDEDKIRLNYDFAEAVEAVGEDTRLGVRYLNCGTSFEIEEYDGSERIVTGIIHY